MSELDENYNIVTSDSDSISSIYNDELNDKINKIMKLKDEGKITSDEAKKLLKQVISLYFEDDIKEGLSAIFPVKQKENKLLFLRYLTEEFYA